MSNSCIKFVSAKNLVIQIFMYCRDLSRKQTSYFEKLIFNNVHI